MTVRDSDKISNFLKYVKKKALKVTVIAIHNFLNLGKIEFEAVCLESHANDLSANCIWKSFVLKSFVHLLCIQHHLHGVQKLVSIFTPS